eukprot:TRINITY_DN10764_c0_g1_i2.p1 TRINITY_DN10764_c0_g1~~TRINITY_DN10764_c0_g1_i2.p1  ORF type:complete len:148 (+),score=26.72 TRINITY_DN10764_c0_g1_i2:468-911(+)
MLVVKLKGKGELEGKELTVINTHVNFKTRATDILELRDRILDIKGMSVSMGDFNATPDEKWWEELRKVGIIDTFYETHKEHPLETYNSGKNKGKPIDFILSNNIPAGSILSSWITEDSKNTKGVSLGAMPNANVPSDHVPLTSVFQL